MSKRLSKGIIITVTLVSLITVLSSCRKEPPVIISNAVSKREYTFENKSKNSLGSFKIEKSGGKNYGNFGKAV